jgi:hypothetical protein
LVDRVLLFAAKEGVPVEDAGDLLSSIRDLKGSITNLANLSVGEDSSGRGGGYTRGFFVRLRTADDLQTCLEHPKPRAVAEKPAELTTGRPAVDYDPEP